MTPTRRSLSRRRALQLLGGGGLVGLAGCTSAAESLVGDDSDADADQPPASPREPPTESPDTSMEVTARAATEQSASASVTPNWLYNDAFPAPEIRAAEGDIVGVSLTNQLPAPTSIHWHGLPVANAMDGVPNLTQKPVAPGDSFDYRFRADPPGTYFYHSHAGLQLDRGLAGPLVVEEANPHVDYDRDYVLLLDDYLAGEPHPPEQGGQSGMAPSCSDVSDSGD